MAQEDEKMLFEELEKGTNHQSLMAMTERIARSGWLLLVIGIGFFAIAGESPIAYAILLGAVALLVSSFVMGVQADRLRKQIQDEVDRRLGRN